MILGQTVLEDIRLPHIVRTTTTITTTTAQADGPYENRAKRRPTSALKFWEFWVQLTVYLTTECSHN